MKRFLTFLLSLSVLLSSLLLTGCHGTMDPDRGAQNGLEDEIFQPPERFDESKPITITFWAKNESNRTQVNIYKQAIADFEALYPNVTVEMLSYNDYGKIYNDVITNIRTKTTPNVCVTYPDHIATYLSGSQVVVSLDALMADPNYGLGGAALKFDSPSREELVPQFLAECSIAGRCYALPYMRSTEACYVNKTFVEALGYELPEVLTWDFVWEVSEKALEKNPDGSFKLNGQQKLIPFIYKSTDNMMIQMLRQKDAGYSTAEGEILLFNDTTRELLQEVAVHARSRAFSTFKISSYPGNWFNAGQCIFAVDSTAGATWMGTDAPLLDIPEEELVEFETVVLPVPQFDPANPKMISQGPSVCVFYKDDPQEVLASWLFTQFLLTNSVQIPYAETEGYVPVTLKARQDPGYQDYLDRAGEDNREHYRTKIDATRLLLENTENTFTTPVFRGSPSVRDAAGTLIESVCKSERRGSEVNSTLLNKIFSETRSLYQLDQIQAEHIDTSAPLPAAALALLATLAAVWVLIGLVSGYSALKRKRAKEKS